MVAAGNLGGGLDEQGVAARQNFLADGCVRFHDGTFFRRQRTRFEQDAVGDMHLADIVHLRGDLDRAGEFTIKTKIFRDDAADRRHADDVVARIGVAAFGRAREPQNDLLLARHDLAHCLIDGGLQFVAARFERALSAVEGIKIADARFQFDRIDGLQEKSR